MKEDLARVGLPGWSLIGVLEAGVNPYSGMFANGPARSPDNNARPANTFPFQNANFDWQSRRPVGQLARLFGNQQSGLRHADLRPHQFARARRDVGLRSGRVDGLLDARLFRRILRLRLQSAVRPNTAFTYRLTYQNFRAAVQAQVGSYGIGNTTNGMYQGQLGFDFGSLSVDGVLSWAKDAVSLSSFSGSNIACLTPANCFINVNNQFFDPNTVLKATLSNDLGGELVARYKLDPVP